MLRIFKNEEPEKTTNEDQQDAYLRLKKINNLNQEIFNLKDKLEEYKNFRSSLESLSTDLDSVKDKISKSSLALSEAILIDNFGIGQESMGELVTYASRYSRSIQYNLPTIDAKILNLTNSISNKQQALNDLQ